MTKSTPTSHLPPSNIVTATPLPPRRRCSPAGPIRSLPRHDTLCRQTIARRSRRGTQGLWRQQQPHPRLFPTHVTRPPPPTTADSPSSSTATQDRPRLMIRPTRLIRHLGRVMTKSKATKTERNCTPSQPLHILQSPDEDTTLRRKKSRPTKRALAVEEEVTPRRTATRQTRAELVHPAAARSSSQRALPCVSCYFWRRTRSASARSWSRS